MTSSLPEFIRGNQRSYLRVACDMQSLERGYEYSMYTRNDIQFLLPGTFRNMDGEEYLYFDISSRQSLDVLLQVKKMNRQMAQKLFSDILKLCSEMDKYLLNLQKVSFRSRHIMYSQEKGNFRFLYNFSGQGDQWQQDLVQLAETLVERLDYDDNELVEAVYHFYEFLMDNQETIHLKETAQAVLDAITEPEAGGNDTDMGTEPPRENESLMKSGQKPENTRSADPREKSRKQGKEKTFKQGESAVCEKYKKGLLTEALLLLGADVCSVFIVTSDQIAVRIFQIAAAVICLLMIVRQLWYRKKEKEAKKASQKEKEKETAQEYREEFQTLLQTGEQMSDGTQIIAMEQVFPKLYSVYGREPEYIEIVGNQLVGAQADLVQVCLNSPGVSRIHASVRRDQQGNSILEDLNSTNGTWVNESRLSPRVPYVLNRGDKVSFAGCDYIFR
ncbi:MAG: FHA domain-containing protein [Lachnospiraceae bacterium]|nr:FHA domain-containing protein [Lachnospiraceae bacterium]